MKFIAILLQTTITFAPSSIREPNWKPAFKTEKWFEFKKKNISYRMLYLHPLNFSFMKLNNSTNFKNIVRKAQNNDRSFSTQNNI